MTELDILVIEDDQLQRKALFDRISKWGHSVQACECITDAKKFISKKSYDLILIDMRLPDGDGLEFLAKLKDGGCKSGIVIMTAFADVETAVSAIKFGAYDYLPKPFEDEHLEKIIRNICSSVDLSSRVASLSQLTIGGYDGVWQLDNMIGTGALQNIFKKTERVAGFSDATVLITGESGTGKGMLAKAIHRLSKRVNKPFVDINCSAIPGQLIESEVFGYDKGAFTDAKASKPGLLEVANEGTVFLDEIGDMDVNLQSKLLKVIEDKTFRRLGSGKVTSVDVRIIAATSRNLAKLTKEGKFREDLFYRLSVVPINLPPLREHQDSILPLANYYLDSFAREMGRGSMQFSEEVIFAMGDYAWPGNIRELRNAVERSVILAVDDVIDTDALGLVDSSLGFSASAQENESSVQYGGGEMHPMSLAECEKRLITSVLKTVSGNKNKAADVLQIHRTTLYKKIEEYGLK